MRYRHVLDAAAGLRGLTRRRAILAARDQQTRALADLSRPSRADDSRNDPAVRPNKKRSRDRLDAKAVHQRFVRERDRIIDLESLDERRDRAESLTLQQVARNDDYHESASFVVTLVERDQLRNLPPARTAPRRPEIHDHRMPPILAQIDLVAVETSRRKVQSPVGMSRLSMSRLNARPSRFRLLRLHQRFRLPIPS